MSPVVNLTEQNDLRNAVILLNEFNNIRIPVGTPIPGAISGAAGGGGGSNLANGTYFYKFTAVDASGNETIAGNEVSQAVSGGTTNNQVIFGAATAILGAASYKAYRGTAAGAEAGFYTLTSSQWTTGFTDNGAGGFALTGSTAPPTTSIAFYTPLQDAILDTATTVAALKNLIYQGTNADPKVGIQDKNFGRMLAGTSNLVDLVDRMTVISTRFPVPATPTCAGVGAGSTYGQGAGTYYFKVTAIDSQGRESVASAESTGFVVTNQNSITVTFTTITNATSYRIYRGNASGAQNGYQTATTSPFSDTGVAGTAGTPPTKLFSDAGPSIFDDAQIAALTTFAGLIALLTNAANVTLSGSLTAGQQSE